MESTPPAATVVRTWSGGTATLTVTYTDGTARTIGGARAARAAAVIVFQDLAGKVCQYGARNDLAKAQAEAVKLVTGGEQLIRNPVRGLPARRRPVGPVATWAFAAPVVDA
jgi:hypothetical protein